MQVFKKRIWTQASLHHRSDLALHGSLPVNSERKNIALSVLVGWVARCVVLLPYSLSFYFYTLFLLIRGLSPRVPRTQIALTLWPAPGDCYRKVKSTRVRSLPMPALGTMNMNCGQLSSHDTQLAADEMLHTEQTFHVCFLEPTLTVCLDAWSGYKFCKKH